MSFTLTCFAVGTLLAVAAVRTDSPFNLFFAGWCMALGAMDIVRRRHTEWTRRNLEVLRQGIINDKGSGQ